MKYLGLLVGLFTATTMSGQTVVLSPTNGVWRYLDNGSDQGTAWRGRTFDDSGWGLGTAPFGYGMASITTTNTTGRITIYYRRTFPDPGPSFYSNLIVRLRRDDGGIVWLNDVEVFRSNMPTGAVDRLTLASSSISGATQFSYFSNNVSPSLLLAGTNQLAVEIHQASSNNVDAAFDLELLGLRVPCRPPMITTQPQSTTAGGEVVTLTVAASGTGPLDYQWWKNGATLGSATSSSLTISTVQFSNAANYTVVVANACGSSTSRVARVSFLSLDVYPGLLLYGPTGGMYRIDYTLDLAPPTNWLVLTNITLPTNPYLWPDPTPARTARRFYRAIPLP